MISCKTCDHYEEYLKDRYVMFCNKHNDAYGSTGDCSGHTNQKKEQPKHQAIACTKCGHEMRIEG